MLGCVRSVPVREHRGRIVLGARRRRELSRNHGLAEHFGDLWRERFGKRQAVKAWLVGTEAGVRVIAVRHSCPRRHHSIGAPQPFGSPCAARILRSPRDGRGCALRRTEWHGVQLRKGRGRRRAGFAQQFRDSTFQFDLQQKRYFELRHLLRRNLPQISHGEDPVTLHFLADGSNVHFGAAELFSDLQPACLGVQELGGRPKDARDAHTSSSNTRTGVSSMLAADSPCFVLLRAADARSRLAGSAFAGVDNGVLKRGSTRAR